VVVKVTVGCGAELRGEVRLSQLADILFGVPGGKFDAPGNLHRDQPEKDLCGGAYSGTSGFQILSNQNFIRPIDLYDFLLLPSTGIRQSVDCQ
jgi:hypothetical protein